MRAWSELWVRVRALLARRRMERELEEEISFHLDRETDKLIARGLSPEAARREAYRSFGGLERQRERTREAWGVRGLEALGRDFRLGFRRMARSPGFSAVATLTLALGVGGTTATFAVVNALLLRPLPYPEGDRLVWIASEAMITADNLGEWRAGLGLVEELGAFRIGSRVLRGRGPARTVAFMPVSDEYLTLLGARPVLGRLWTEAESRPGAAPVALVSHRIWTEELLGAELAGQAVTVGDVRYEVVGVLPQGFHNLGYAADLWIPLSRGVGSYHMVGRLRPGGTAETAQREVDALLPRLGPQPGSDLLGTTTTVTALRDTDRFAGEVRTPVLVLFAAAGLVLMLALANLVNLLLSRASVRERERSVRSALGAGKAALLRQSLVESSLLALAGGGLGLLLARVGIRSMLALAPSSLVDGLVGGAAGIDGVVLAFTLLVTAAAAGVAALVSSVPGDASGGIRSTVSRTHARWRDLLVGVEVALALVMLIGTMLLVRTYGALRPAAPGFETADRLVMPLELPGRLQVRDNLGPAPEDPANIELVRRLISSVEGGAPGARGAAVTWPPLSGNYNITRVVEVDGGPVAADDGSELEIGLQSATPSYLEVMGIAVTRGRGLVESDAVGAPLVAVVSEEAARRLWPELESPVGRRLTLDPYGANRPKPPDAAARPPSGPQVIELMVVGVVRDVRASGSHTRSRPEVYVSYWQVPWPVVHVVVHTPARGGVTAEKLRAAVAALDRTVPVGEITTLESIAGEAVAQPRYEMTLMAIFGALAALLAVIGCYGVMAYTVAQRTREIGIRIALGASRRSATAEVLARGARVVGGGLVGGIVLSALVTRVLDRSLYGVSATDPLTFALAASVLALATLLASWIPARRAASVEPALTLRQE